MPGDSQASVIDHVRRTIHDERIAIEPFHGNAEPTPVSSTTSRAAYQMLNRTIREIFPDVVVAPGLMLAGTNSRHYAGIADSIFRFSPVRANSDDLKRFHGTNERLSIEGYADMIRFYRRLLENSGGVTAQQSFRDGPKDQTSDVQLHIGNLEVPGSLALLAPSATSATRLRGERRLSLTPPASAIRESRRPRAAC